MNRSELFQKSQRAALAMYVDEHIGRSPNAFYNYYRTRLVLAREYRTDRVVSERELAAIERYSREGAEIMKWGTKKLGSRAKVVKHLLDLPSKYFEKFGERMDTAYHNYIHEQALAAHQVVKG